MDGSGFDPTIGALNTILNLRLMNQNIIASNIANAETPGYKAQRVDFETSLRDALNSQHNTDPVRVEIFNDPNGIESIDGNTVSRSNEMSLMAENEVLYNSAVELLKKKLGMLKYSITEGGGNR